MNGTKVRISILFVTVLLCVVWAAAVWEYEDNQFRHQTEALTNKEEINTKTRGETISADIQHSLRIGAALPELLATIDEVIATVASRKPSDAPAPQRLAKIKTEAQQPRIASLNHLLALANNDFSSDVVWVVDTNGDCIAASNFDSPLTFIGANYKERHYFTGAMAGDTAYQFAVGKVSHEPGLYFSAPIFKNQRVIGAVVVKVAIARLAQHIDFSNVFVVDENGVAVLAQDPHFEMKAVTGNLIAGMSYERRMSTYFRSQFEALEIRPWPGYPRLSMVGSANEPYMINQTVVDQGQLTIYVLSPASQILAMNQEFMRLFVLLTLCGSAIVVIIGFNGTKMSGLRSLTRIEQAELDTAVQKHGMFRSARLGARVPF